MHKFPNDVNIRVSFHRLRKEFQKTLKETRHKFFNAMIQKLDDLHENQLQNTFTNLCTIKREI
jgi:hypothetical protein